MAAKKSSSTVVQTAVKNAHVWVAPLPDIPRQAADNKTTFFVGETPYASVELQGDTLNFRLRKPKDVPELEPMLRFYDERKEEGQDWLYFSMPANNKPGPALEAGIGRFAGTILRQLRSPQGA